MKNLIVTCLLIILIRLAMSAQTYYDRISTVTVPDKTELNKIDSIVSISRFKNAKYISLSFFNATDLTMRHFYDTINTDTTYYINISGDMSPICDSSDCIAKLGKRYFILPPNTPWEMKPAIKKIFCYSRDELFTKYFTYYPLLIERSTEGKMTQVPDTTERYYFLIE